VIAHINHVHVRVRATDVRMRLYISVRNTSIDWNIVEKVDKAILQVEKKGKGIEVSRDWTYT